MAGAGASPKATQVPLSGQALSALFRGKFLDGLNDLMGQGVLPLRRSVLERPEGRQTLVFPALRQKMGGLCQTALGDRSRS